MSNLPPPGQPPQGPPPGSIPPAPGSAPPPGAANWGEPAQIGWTPPGGGTPAPGTWGGPPVVAPPASPAAKRAGWFIAAAGLVVVVAAILPWLSLSGEGADSVEEMMKAQGEGVGGLDKDGAFTIVLGVVALVLGVVRGTGRAIRAAAITGLVMGALTTLIAIIDLADVQSTADDIPALFDFDISPGIGLWLTLVGGIAVLATSGWALAKR